MSLWIPAIMWGALTLMLGGSVFNCLPIRRRPADSETPNILDRPAVLLIIAILARGLSWWIVFGRDHATDPLHDVDRGFFLVLSVGTCWLLCAAAENHQLPRRVVLFYAANPLAVWAWLQGWPSVLLTFLIVAAIHAAHQKRNPWLAPMLMGAAIAVNVGALTVLPFLANRKNRRWLWIAALPPLFTMTNWTGGLPLEPDLGFAAFLQNSVRLLQGNEPVFTTWFLADALSGIGWLAKPWIYYAALILLMIVIMAIRVLTADDVPGAVTVGWMWALALFPGLGPQHLMPLAALMIFSPQRSWLAVIAGSGAWIFWGYDAWLLPGFWMLLLAGLAYDSIRLMKPGARCYGPLTSMDIIIPTLNEGDNLGPMLAELQTASDTLREYLEEEVSESCRITRFIVDGGSTDNTLAIARESGAELVAMNTPGRGSQLAGGIAAGTGDLVLMLHADTRIQPQALKNLYRKLNAAPRVEWGILGHIFSRRDIRMRLNEITCRLRFHLIGIAFGDQGIFVRRDVLKAIGGMPDLPLMEDLELSLRLTRYKSRLDCGRSLLVSTRQWDRHSDSAYMKSVLRLSALYLWARARGIPVHQLAGRLYERYYRQPRTRAEATGAS